MHLFILVGLVIGALANDEKNCVELPEPGFCRGKFASYYYDANEDDCVEGCGQNGNSYVTYDECKSACIDSKSWGSDVCNLPFEPGTGSDNLKRFGFNNALGECTRFVYTGEGGNGNNFESLEECRGVCGKAEHLPSACQQEKEVGECRAAVPRYFYNQETGECEFFIYGGCNGNSNNFNTKDDCEDVCKA
ncbi:boophilin-H2-like [Parasteatoda tepidariorum]|uniref:boophilin-H2-like n=1 Tax=Parasteatoda tepidariorum TaxID=114398 RepID=UPI00077F8DFB|nr:actinia tenebrosa protease inhibitors-like [Parasteatoda tepidariorum]